MDPDYIHDNGSNANNVSRTLKWVYGSTQMNLSSPNTEGVLSCIDFGEVLVSDTDSDRTDFNSVGQNITISESSSSNTANNSNLRAQKKIFKRLSQTRVWKRNEKKMKVNSGQPYVTAGDNFR